MCPKRSEKEAGSRRAGLWPILSLAGLLAAVASLAVLYRADRALADGERLSLTDPAGDRLAATYHDGSQAAGVLLLEGFGSDQVALRSAASEFAGAGVHVLAVDFSGQGRSPGGLTFDNAATDRLARQVLVAQEELGRRASLTPDRIVLLGHSMGARVALQAATMTAEPPAGLILLGVQVNLAANVQSQFFTGVQDTDLAWVGALGPGEPASNILLLSGRWDDILPLENAQLLLERLAGVPAAAGEAYGSLEQGTGRRWEISGLFHNFEPIQPQTLALAKRWANEVWPDDVYVDGSTPTASLRLAAWAVALAGLLLAVLGGRRWAAAALARQAPPTARIRVRSVGRFLRAKLLLWLPAIPVAGLLSGGLFLIPKPVPVFALLYVGFLGGYGLLMGLCYWRGWVPGTEGRLPFRERVLERQPLAWDRLLLGLAVAGATFGLTALYARSGWFQIPPLGDRLLWLVLLTPPTALGFWIGWQEWAMLGDAEPHRRRPFVWLSLSGLLPFLLWTLFQAILGSLSGMVAGVLGLVILAFVLAFGGLMRQITGPPWLTAVAQAALLYWLALPQGALFVM
jgi:pimeloyl-ACP methyl ester carboxylesterase